MENTLYKYHLTIVHRKMQAELSNTMVYMPIVLDLICFPIRCMWFYPKILILKRQFIFILKFLSNYN